jgi:PHP family Zn ribbon phosphoesterase
MLTTCVTCHKQFKSQVTRREYHCKQCNSKANAEAGLTIEEWFGPADANMIYPITDPDKYED